MSVLSRLATARAITRLSAVLAAVVLGAPGSALAHSPDPLLGTTPWGQNQVVNYQWAAGQVPPAWLASAIDAGAADSGSTRASRSALFVRAASAPSKIAYGGTHPCPSYGIACMNRSGVPVSFGMWFRPHGAVLDWGTLRWCQAQATPTNGCYDARRVALDEFGHVQILNHHVNYEDERDYLDAVVQYAGRSRPREGWDVHVYGRCDVARLQLEYELQNAGDPVSTCLSLATALQVAAASTWVPKGSSARITGELAIAASTSARRLSGDPLSRRAVTLQRRDLMSSSWVSLATMSAVSGMDGAYAAVFTPTATADYRLFFDAPVYEGLRDSTSSVVRVTVGPACTAATWRDGSLAVPCE